MCVTLQLAASEPSAPSLVSFATEDGGRIEAHLYGSGKKAVILAHGRVFDKESWRPQAEVLAAAGFKVLAVDFRGYGRSEPGTRPDDLHLDILAAIQYLRGIDMTGISVVGASMGGGAAGRAATRVEPGEIQRLILLAPAPIEHSESLQAERIIYIASRHEPGVQSIRRQYEVAPEPKHLELLDGSAHAQHVFKTEQADRLTELIVALLSD